VGALFLGVSLQSLEHLSFDLGSEALTVVQGGNTGGGMGVEVRRGRISVGALLLGVALQRLEHPSLDLGPKTLTVLCRERISLGVVLYPG